jgi:hypothetical protein
MYSGINKLSHTIEFKMASTFFFSADPFAHGGRRVLYSAKYLQRSRTARQTGY